MKKITQLIIACFLTTTLHAQFQWANSFGDSSNDTGLSILTDSSGNIYTAGSFQGTVDFDPGTGIDNHTSLGEQDPFIQKTDEFGNLLWAKSFGGINAVIGKTIKLDVSGNIYVTGHFKGTADFDPGTATVNLTSQGDYDVFLLKLDTNGNFLWAKSFGGISDDLVISMTVDATGNIYSTGYYSGTVDFDPSAGTTNITSAGGEDVFIHKLDASGNFVWAKTFGGSSNERGYSISIDNSGNVYTTGYFFDTVDFDPGAGVVNYTSLGGTDIFIQKLDASGNFVWAKTVGGTSYDYGFALSVDASGNVYTTGYFVGPVDFDPGSNTYYINNVTPNHQTFIQKLDTSGNFLWARGTGGIGTNSRGHAMCLDALGNVYTAGYFDGTIDFAPEINGVGLLSSAGGFDIFIQKRDAFGNYVWTISLGGILDELALGISIDASGNIYTTGVFQDTVDFDPGAGTANLTSMGNSDIFVLKMNEANLSIEENSFGNELVVYPNPTNSHFSIDLGQVYENTNVSIADINGRLIDSKSFHQTQTIDFPLEASAGVYLVIVNSGEKKSVFKLIKQ